MKKEIALLLRKFLLGKSSPEEDRQLDRWYGESSLPDIRLSVAEWREIKERIWYRIEGRIHKTPILLYLRVIRSVAASVAAALLIASFWFFLQEGNTGNRQSEQTLLAQVTEKTATGEIRQIHLPDGTSVWLNDRTSLRYDGHFGNKSREVILEGEAFFDVARDTERPFIVHAGATNTQVLGTSFNIKSYPDERQQITVATGQVSVEILFNESRQYRELHPSGRLEFDPDRKTVSQHQVNVKNLTAWRDNKLVFDRLPLRDVAKILERKYGVSIRITAAGTGDRLFSGTFAGKDLPHILWAVEHSMDVSIERSAGNQIVIMNNKKYTNE
ncbi:MAG: FecR domain-containing protein [Dysgonamonadaceae bacterium]|nr:FecR domain-containing protein [Dysgonamonadaceae bacterium]